MAVTGRYATRRQFLKGVAAVGVAVSVAATVTLPAMKPVPMTAAEISMRMMYYMDHIQDSMRYAMMSGTSIVKEGRVVPMSEWLRCAGPERWKEREGCVG